MRGIEGALCALQGAREGRFVGETLRALGGEMSAGATAPLRGPELSLASSLSYAALRREALWKSVFGAYVRKNRTGKPQELVPILSDCLLLGAAGLLELHHFAPGVLVNGLLEILKSKGQEKAVPMANAVLHNVAREGPAMLEKLRRSSLLEDRALWAGIPQWTLPAWKKSWTNEDLFVLFAMMQIPPHASLRTPPGKREEVLALLAEDGEEGTPSDLFPDSIHLASTLLPTLAPGFERGLTTVQTEGSMLVASLVVDFMRPKGGLILDMCSGRGVKMGQIAQSLSSLSGMRLEGWELSSGRHFAAVKEMARLGLKDRVTLRFGDALSLAPSEKPSLVFLDAPCTGSGTWNRKPESKWRLSWAKLDKTCELQRALLRRALSLVGAGGVIIYATCSLLRQENENTVAEALSEYPDCTVLDIPWRGNHIRRGRPWGTYIWPASPWLDGFYVSVIMKRT